MKRGSTLFLKAVIYVIGLLTVFLCIILLGVTLSGNGGIYLPLELSMCATALPFFYALYQGILLIKHIDTNAAFSEHSVQAIKKIKWSAGIISAFYALLMPLYAQSAMWGDTLGPVVLALVFMFVTLVTAVFAAVLEKLFQQAIEIKSENDLTV